jgi:hypothetical protein
MNADGSEVEPLPPITDGAAFGIPSPDGQRVAYSESHPYTSPTPGIRLIVANADGSGPVVVDSLVF